MHLGSDYDDDRAETGQDEQHAGHPGEAGAQAAQEHRRGRVPGLGPGDNHAEPGDAPPSPVPQCRCPSLFAWSLPL